MKTYNELLNEQKFNSLDEFMNTTNKFISDTKALKKSIKSDLNKYIRLIEKHNVEYQILMESIEESELEEIIDNDIVDKKIDQIVDEWITDDVSNMFISIIQEEL